MEEIRTELVLLTSKTEDGWTTYACPRQPYTLVSDQIRGDGSTPKKSAASALFNLGGELVKPKGKADAS
jgi:hypothetical protein